jgi:hypothetical protein
LSFVVTATVVKLESSTIIFLGVMNLIVRKVGNKINP